MGINVISSASSGSANHGSGSPSPSEAGPGQFAGLLSGQLQNIASTLNGLTDGNGLRGILNKGTNDGTADAPADTSDTPGLPDLALIVALTAQPPLGQTAAPAGAANAADRDEKSPAMELLGSGLLKAGREHGAPKDEEALALAELEQRSGAQKTGKSAAPGEFQKLILAGNAAKGAGLQQDTTRGLPANLAAEKNALPNESPAANVSIIQQTINQLPATTTGAASQASISAPLHDNAWPQQLGDKIVWMAKGDQQSAQININPPQLGPLLLTIHLNGDQVNAAFASPHAEVRHAIENALPQLRDMLSSAGINLGQADVGANMARQNPQMPFQTPNGKHLGSETAILPANGNATNSGTSPVLQRGRGLVDLFA